MAMGHLPKGSVKRVFAGTEFVKGPTLIQRSRSKSAEEKAIYHNVTGAGRAGVRRPFMDLNDEDQNDLTQKLAEGIDRLLAGER